VKYADVIATALTYADRADDQELTPIMDTFLRVVESRVNRFLQTRRQSRRATITTEIGKEYYGLPADFAGLRNIVLKSTTATSGGRVMNYATPEVINTYIDQDLHDPHYSIIGNSIMVMPKTESMVIEITYYQRLVPLTSVANSNWLTESNPDAYVFGLLTEIAAYARDSEGATLWDGRFRSSLDEIALEDAIDRWSGPTPTVRVL
jgi:hypothetical protein